MSHMICHKCHEPRTPGREQRSRDAVRSETDRMLRDIAFVLKMAERVRRDIETPTAVEEPALA